MIEAKHVNNIHVRQALFRNQFSELGWAEMSKIDKVGSCQHALELLNLRKYHILSYIINGSMLLSSGV